MLIQLDQILLGRDILESCVLPKTQFEEKVRIVTFLLWLMCQNAVCHQLVKCHLHEYHVSMLFNCNGFHYLDNPRNLEIIVRLQEYRLDHPVNYLAQRSLIDTNEVFEHELVTKYLLT